MTAFYMFRVVFMTFGGESRAVQDNGQVGAHSEGHGQPHESPRVMVIPMLVLAVLAVISGFWGVTGHFASFMGEGGETRSFLSGLFSVFTHPLPWIALIVAGLGILLAYALYSAEWFSAQKIGDTFKPLYTLFFRKYFMDELYENIIVKLSLMGGLFSRFQWFDSSVVDGVANEVGDGPLESGKVLRKTESGQLQIYGLTIALGLVAIIICVFIFGK
jgi:NADH-quinone oxidoreductase subunit L